MKTEQGDSQKTDQITSDWMGFIQIQKSLQNKQPEVRIVD